MTKLEFIRRYVLACALNNNPPRINMPGMFKSWLWSVKREAEKVWDELNAEYGPDEPVPRPSVEESDPWEPF